MSDDVERLLATLTLEQKAGLLSGLDSWRTKPLPASGVPAVWLSDGPHGVRRELAALESEPSTCFPNESALAATWDRELITEVGAALGAEARSLGVGVLLGPGINLKRTPLCGRNFEYLSEDPTVTGELAVAYVRGVQSQGVGTSPKHFAANNQEWGRHWVSSDVDERTLRELYLAAFEQVVTQAEPWTVMCSYNRVNGVHTSQHHWLLTEVLREEWGFAGVVVSDWGAVHNRVAALAAGLDLEMPGGTPTDAEVVAAVHEGRLDEACVDRAARRVLELARAAVPAPMTRLIRWGEAENTPGAEGQRPRGEKLPTPEAAPPSGTAEAVAAENAESVAPRLGEAMVAAHHALAERAAEAAVTLLRNDGCLPLENDARVAVVGPYAAIPRIQGAGSALVEPTRTPVSAVKALRGALGSVTYAPGFAINSEARDADLETAAVDAVRAADIALVFVSQGDGVESEGYDRAHLDLPENQLRVLDAALATGTPVIVVVNAGSVVLLGDWHDRAAAIVHCPYLGQGGGPALASVLTGAAEPSGRLSETWPLRLEDTPAFATYPGERGHVRYGEGVLVGYRWYDALDLPVRYPFGHGLTYTAFAYERVSARVIDDIGTVRVELDVRNVGERPGSEVVQVYVAPPRRAWGVPIVDGQPTEPLPYTPVRRAVRELRDFAKIALQPGEATTLAFTLTSRAFSYWDVDAATWRRDAGRHRIEIGASSRDLRVAAEVELSASPADLPEPTDVELQDTVYARSAAQV